MRMKAIKAFPYAGQRISVGDLFEARADRDVRVLEAMGKAERFAVVPALERETDPVDGVPAQKQRRTYRRRDLTAE